MARRQRRAQVHCVPLSLALLGTLSIKNVDVVIFSVPFVYRVRIPL